MSNVKYPLDCISHVESPFSFIFVHIIIIIISVTYQSLAVFLQVSNMTASLARSICIINTIEFLYYTASAIVQVPDGVQTISVSPAYGSVLNT